jgi:hypothetical protein
LAFNKRGTSESEGVPNFEVVNESRADKCVFVQGPYQRTHSIIGLKKLTRAREKGGVRAIDLSIKEADTANRIFNSQYKRKKDGVR